MTRPKAVFIVGYGRSGSTLLDNVLGEVEGFFAAGELHNIWDAELLERRPCGCGKAVQECEIWPSVLDSIGEVAGDPRNMERQREVWRVTKTARVLRQGAAASASWDAARRYADTTERLYAAILRTTDRSVVVDSSKRPSFAALLRLTDIDTYFVHLIRDPRAIAFSWQRKKEELGQHSVAYSTSRWQMWNAAAELVRRKVPHDRWIRIRYEDFMEQPRETISRITTAVGEGTASSPFIDQKTVLLSRNHGVAGNPNRFRTGRVEMRIDDEWKRRLGPSDKAVTTALALPLLRRYGYPIRSRQ